MEERIHIKEWVSLRNEARPKVRFWVPAAAMEEADLKTELKLLKDRGFGGVEVVALLGTPEEIVSGEDGWGTDNWNHMIDIIARTTKELDMTMDLANGPMWPISMPTVKNADDPAALRELTYGIIDCPKEGHYVGPLPERRVKHEEVSAQLIQVMAYQQRKDGRLLQASYQNLNRAVSGEGEEAVLAVTLPSAEQGCKWLIFSFYSQPSVQKTGCDNYYVIDHLSKEGIKACEEYWDPIFKEYDKYPSMESFFCDSLEYHTSMDWSRDFTEEFENRRGYSVLPFLPFLGYAGTYPEGDVPAYQLENPEISDMINRDYFETVTQCYCQNHLKPLEEMAKKYGKGIRYQVAYNKTIEVERSGLYIEIPENEALGRPAMDGLKTMAAAAHLGRKKRYSFECAAEFGNSYGQNYEDLFWWVKRSLISGMNAQVLHGAAYSGAYNGKYSGDGFMKGVEWPGYEAFLRLVSNYWNRTLSIEDARGCLDTITRMNTLFLKKAKVDCAIYRAAYINDGKESEFCFFKDGGILSNHGYSYETVSPALLELPVCKVENKILDPDGVGYQCLIVPESEQVSMSFLRKVEEFLEQKFPVIWIGKKPQNSMFYMDWRLENAQLEWKELMNRLWENPRLIHVDNIDNVVETLKRHSIRPVIELEGGKDLVAATRIDEDDKVTYYAIYGYNRILYTPEELNPQELACSAFYQKGTTKSTYERPGEKSRESVKVSLKGTGQVCICNPWNGKLLPIDFKDNQGRMEGGVSIEEDELIILGMFHDKKIGEAQSGEKITADQIAVTFHTLELQEFLPTKEDEKSFLRSDFSQEKKIYKIKELVPWKELDTALETFAGKGTYRGSILLEKKKSSYEYILCLGDVSDTFQVFVNGRKTEFPDQVLKEVDITEYLIEGNNELEVVVVSNLFNRLLHDYKHPAIPIQLPYIAKKFGIWEDDKKCVLKVVQK